MNANSELLNRTVVFSSTNFPGRTQEGLLLQLLRKKLEPQVETWVGEGRALQADPKTDIGETEREILKYIKERNPEKAREYITESDPYYTKEENEIGRETVRTGLRRKDEEDESEDGDQDEEMEDVGAQVTSVRRESSGDVKFGIGEIKPAPKAPGRGLEDILRFATSGMVIGQPSPARR